MLQILNNANYGTWVEWTPTNSDTNRADTYPPYGLSTLSADDAFNTYGGGP